jgi:O-antigen/teichoic acid export membrane protein
MSTAYRVIKNSGLLYAKMALTVFISLYTTRLILNALGSSDFGLFNVVGGAIAMFGFLNGAMASATQRFMSYTEGQGNIEMQKKIFNISFVLHLVISLLMILVFIVAGYFFFGFILKIPADRIFASKIVYGSIVFSTAITIITVPYDAVLNAHENMFYFSIIGVLESILKLGVALLITNSSLDKLILYGIMMASIPLITLSIMWIYCHRKYEECEISPQKYWDKKLEKKMTSFAGWNFFLISSGMISQYGLNIVLNNFFGVILNTAFAIANLVSGQLMVFSNTMMKALNPVIAKSEGVGNRVRVLSASLRGSKYGFLILAFFVIPFIIETPYILKIWLNNVPDWAILFCRLQLIRSLVEQLTVTLGVTINAQGEIKWYTIFRSVVNISPIIATFILFKFGLPPYYMYVVWIITWGGFGGWLLVYFSKKNCNLAYSDFLKVVLIPNVILIFVMVLPSFILIHLMESNFSRFILVSTVSSVALLTSFLTFYATLSEKKTILNVLLFILRKLQTNIQRQD